MLVWQKKSHFYIILFQTTQSVKSCEEIPNDIEGPGEYFPESNDKFVRVCIGRYFSAVTCILCMLGTELDIKVPSVSIYRLCPVTMTSRGRGMVPFVLVELLGL